MSPPRPSRFDRWAARLVPEGSTGRDRQLRLYLALVFALFVPTTLVVAWFNWIRGDRVTGILVAVICGILLTFLYTLRRARDIRWGYRAVLGPAVVLLTAILFLGGADGYVSLWYYVFPAGFYFVFGTREGSAWVVLMIAPAAVILLTDIGASYSGDLAYRFVATFSLMTALALGLQLARDRADRELAREKEALEAALARVRTLSEMLPMCAWCRKVRDDEGYWMRIEEYLREETGTEVSHGICDDCAVMLEQRVESETAHSVDDGPGRPA